MPARAQRKRFYRRSERRDKLSRAVERILNFIDGELVEPATARFLENIEPAPGNLPLYLLSWKIAPAIACGNTCVAKPSELTPMTAFMLCEIAREAGLPAGVMNIVHGTGANVGAAITAHPEVNTISFTGGTVTGRKVAEAAAAHFKKVSLELGGKNPTLVFADADLKTTIPGTVRASFANQGQVCLCG